MKSTILLLVIFALSEIVSAQPFTGCPTGSEVIAATQAAREDSLFNLVNQVRKDTFGISTPLIRFDKLDNACRYHALDMKTDGYFCHPTMDPNGTESCQSSINKKRICESGQRIQNFVGSAVTNDDALALGYSTAQAVVDAFLAEAWDANPDQPHRDIISGTSWTHTGVGVVANGTSGFYWGIDFVQIPVGFEDLRTKGYYITEASPNPSGYESIFYLQLSNTKNIKIELINLLGQKISELYNGLITANTKEPIKIDSKNLESGIYFYRIKGKSINETRKIVVQK